MKESDKHIDQLFGGPLRDYQEKPPDRLWEHIASRLRQKRKGRYMSPFRLAAAIAMLVALGSGLWYLVYNQGGLNNKQERHIVGLMNDTSEKKEKAVDSSPSPSHGNDLYAIKTDSVLKNNQSADTFSGSSKATPKTKLLNNEKRRTSQKDRASKNPTAQMKTEKTAREQSPSVLHKKECIAITSIQPVYEDHQVQANRFPGVFEQAKIYHTSQLLYGKKQDKPIEGSANSLSKKRDVFLKGRFAPLMAHAGLSGNIEKDADFSSQHVSSRSIAGDEKISSAYNGGLNIEIATGSAFSLITGIQYGKFETSQEYTYSSLRYDETSGHTTKGLSGFASSNQPASLGQADESTNNTETRNETADNRVEEAAGNYNLDQPAPVSITTGSTYDKELASGLTNDQLNNLSDILQHYEFIELPLYGKYPLIDKKLQLNMIGGLSANILVAHKHFIQSDHQQIFFQSSSSLASVNYSGLFGLGISYPVIDRFYFSIEPSMKYHVFLNQQGNIYESLEPFSLALYSGISYRF